MAVETEVILLGDVNCVIAVVQALTTMIVMVVAMIASVAASVGLTAMATAVAGTGLVEWGSVAELVVHTSST